jgi:hypothetical protein
LRKVLNLVLTVLISSAFSFAGVSISSPANGSTVPTSVHVVASASTATSHPISSIIVYVDNVKKYLIYSAKVDTTLVVSAGKHTFLVKSWDGGGNIYQASTTVTASSSTTSSPTPTSGQTTVTLDQASGWQSCDTCAGAAGAGPTAPHTLTQGVSSPSLDGASAHYWIGGSTPYADVLWHKNILNESQVATSRKVHHFIYDLYFYTDNAAAAQSIEWDVNQFLDGRSYIFGSQCSYRAGDSWDVWDNVRSKWVSTGVSCGALQSHTWNHVVLEFERTTDSKLHYIAMTLNGSKHYLNWYYPSTATSWSGVTVNYQMDGNYQQADYSTWVDKMKLTYY